MKILPSHLRKQLKTPIGILVDEKKLLTLLEKEKYIVSIGDQVTYTLLKHDIKPVFCVVDFKTKRGSCSDKVKNLIKSYGDKAVTVENPAGTISDSLWNVIQYAFKNLGKCTLRVEVEGEEDLASLAAIYLAPRDVTIIYGLPDKGILVVKPTDKNKKTVKKILDEM